MGHGLSAEELQALRDIIGKRGEILSAAHAITERNRRLEGFEQTLTSTLEDLRGQLERLRGHEGPSVKAVEVLTRAAEALEAMTDVLDTLIVQEGGDDEEHLDEEYVDEGVTKEEAEGASAG